MTGQRMLLLFCKLPAASPGRFVIQCKSQHERSCCLCLHVYIFVVPLSSSDESAALVVKRREKMGQ